MIGSRPVIGVSVRGQARERAVVPILCGAAALATGASTWMLLDRDPVSAGWSALLAGVILVGAGVLLRPGDRIARVVLSFGDRAFDGLLLGALAWVSRGERPTIAAGALVALAAGFLASYIRAKGGSLGYGVEEGIITPVVRYAVFSVSLIAGWSWGVWVVAVVNLLATGVRSSQVAKEERL